MAGAEARGAARENDSCLVMESLCNSKKQIRSQHAWQA